MQKFFSIINITIVSIALLVSCNNASTDTTGQGQDNPATSQNLQGITVKDRQHFHTYAQKTIDSVQRLVDQTDKKIRKQEIAPIPNWTGARDSVRRILDHANRSLNNQSYHSDEEWSHYKSSIEIAIDSAETIWKRDTGSLK